MIPYVKTSFGAGRSFQVFPGNVTRRRFVQGASCVLAGMTTHLVTNPCHAEQAVSEESAPLRIGLVTDLHHADKPAMGTRHYRQSQDKFAEAQAVFARESVDFAVELGDLIDSADSVDEELEGLDRIHASLRAVACPWHFVLGNHCVHTLTKDEFLGHTSHARTYYSFDHGGWHFVVLDACYRHDGADYGRQNFQWTDANIPNQELRWLADDLERNELPAVVFVHQRLDRDPGDHYAIKQCREVRQVLERSGRVAAVFQGHSHQNDYRQMRGIHYCTLRAMVEGSGVQQSGYAVLDAWPDGTLRVRGFRAQSAYAWDA